MIIGGYQKQDMVIRNANERNGKEKDSKSTTISDKQNLAKHMQLYWQYHLLENKKPEIYLSPRKRLLNVVHNWTNIRSSRKIKEK